MTEKEIIRTEVERRAKILSGTHAGRSSDALPMLEELLFFIDSMQDDDVPEKSCIETIYKKESARKVWHDASIEPPKANTMILVDKEGFVFLKTILINDKYDWNGCKYAYIDDLLKLQDHDKR